MSGHWSDLTGCEISGLGYYPNPLDPDAGRTGKQSSSTSRR